MKRPSRHVGSRDDALKGSGDAQNHSIPEVVDVVSDTQEAGDVWHIATRFRMRRGRGRVGLAHDWGVTLLNNSGKPCREAELHGHQFTREPLLGLAARGAWTLWNDDVPFEAKQLCRALRIRVLSDEKFVAEVLLVLDQVGGTLTGWAWPHRQLCVATFETPGPRDVGHWTRLVLCEVAFADVQPRPQLLARDGRCELPASWA